MSDLSNLVDVAIPVPVAGPFTYSVPDEFAAAIEFGRRILVPFRNKIISGFVVGFPESGAELKNIKQIIDIPDEPPYLTPHLWKFICWIAEYYLLPTGLVPENRSASRFEQTVPTMGYLNAGWKEAVQGQRI